MQIVGIPSTLVTYKFGYRVSVMFGGVLACTGFALSFFCTELHELYLCIGAVAGNYPVQDCYYTNNRVLPGPYKSLKVLKFHTFKYKTLKSP